MADGIQFSQGCRLLGTSRYRLYTGIEISFPNIAGECKTHSSTTHRHGQITCFFIFSTTSDKSLAKCSVLFLNTLKTALASAFLGSPIISFRCSVAVLMLFWAWLMNSSKEGRTEATVVAGAEALARGAALAVHSYEGERRIQFNSEKNKIIQLNENQFSVFFYWNT